MSRELKPIFVELANWSLFLPLITVYILTFLYFHEIGFFTCYGIPTEFLELDLLNSVQYIAVSIAIGLIIIMIVFYPFGSRVETDSGIVKGRTFFIFFLLILIAVLPAFFGFKGPLMWMAIIYLAGLFFLEDAGYREHGKMYFRPVLSKVPHAVGLGLIILSVCCTVSFYLGYFERSGAENIYLRVLLTKKRFNMVDNPTKFYLFNCSYMQLLW